jgi:hypothetical protein
MLPNGVDGLTRQCRVQKFIVECMVYAVTLEHKSYGWSTCRSWPSLQNGTAFFASTRLFAIGDALALLRAGNDAATVLTPPVDLFAHLWEVKCVGPVLICIYLSKICLGVPLVQLRRDPVRRRADRSPSATRRRRRRT